MKEEGTKVTFIQTLILGIVVLLVVGAVALLMTESTGVKSWTASGRAKSMTVGSIGIVIFGPGFMFVEGDERWRLGLYLLQASTIFLAALFFGGEVGIDADGYDGGDNEHDFDIDMG